ncbi:MAG TPA: YceD family protein, partial [Cyclobacteriaceae bacterium]|nr:YceD family protein [Cyclobacteriaceae bacterium]
LGQLVYEFIGLAIPMKKLHPRFQEEDETEEGKMVYSSSTDEEQKEEEVNPMWDKLKKLK